MKLTKSELKEMVAREIKNQLNEGENKDLNEGMAVDESHYFELKKKCEKDFSQVYDLAQRLEDMMYDDDPMEDPMDLIEQLQALAGKWMR